MILKCWKIFAIEWLINDWLVYPRPAAIEFQISTHAGAEGVQAMTAPTAPFKFTRVKCWQKQRISKHSLPTTIQTHIFEVRSYEVDEDQFVHSVKSLGISDVPVGFWFVFDRVPSLYPNKPHFLWRIRSCRPPLPSISAINAYRMDCQFCLPSAKLSIPASPRCYISRPRSRATDHSSRWQWST
jgi:hypothetical protein